MILLIILIFLTLLSLIYLIYAIKYTSKTYEEHFMVSILLLGFIIILGWGVIGTLLPVKSAESIVPIENIEIIRSKDVCFVIVNSNQVYTYYDKKSYSDIDTNLIFYYIKKYNIYNRQCMSIFTYKDELNIQN